MIRFIKLSATREASLHYISVVRKRSGPPVLNTVKPTTNTNEKIRLIITLDTGKVGGGSSKYTVRCPYNSRQ